MPPTADDDTLRRTLLQRAEALAAPLAARAAEIEARRSLPPDIADALAQAGLLRLLTPRAFGGHEVHAATFFDVVETIARFDAATAWCCFIANTACVLAAYLPPDSAAALFGRPDLQAAGVFAPRGQAVAATQGGVAGYRIRGRWAWGSAAHNAHLVSGGCVVLGADGQPELLPGGQPRVLSALFDRAQLHLLDNWHSVGLGGTGSGEFEAVDVFVPAARCCSLFGTPQQPGVLYRFPVFGLLALGIAAVASGIARQAIDALLDLAVDKVPQAGTKTLAQRPATQETVARAEAEWRSARAFVVEAVHAAWDGAALESTMPVAARRDLRLAATHATHTAAAVTTRMYTLAGGSAVFSASPLQRCLRDVHVATQHMMVAEPTWELTGRLLLQQPTSVAML